jgi:glucose-1-phosphate thymidylyltransferase
MRVKGVVLACGGDVPAETPLGAALPRHLVPVGNRPLFEHALEGMARAGIEETAVVVDDRSRAAVRAALGALASRTEIVAVGDGRTPGIADALAAAREFVGDDPFLMHSGDGLLRHDLGRTVDEVATSAADGLLLVHRGHDARAPSLDAHRVRKLLGGVAGDAPPLALAGAHAFGRGVLPALCDHAAATAATSLTALAELAAEAGMRLETRMVEGWWRFDGNPQVLLDVNRAVLEDLRTEHGPIAGVTLQGRVSIHPTAVVRSSTIRGPVIIGPGAQVIDAYVGPYSSIGDGVVVENAEVEDSILMAGSSVRHVGVRIESSVIGRGGRVHRDFSLPRSVRLRVGDHTEVQLS